MQNEHEEIWFQQKKMWIKSIAVPVVDSVVAGSVEAAEMKKDA